MSLQQQKIINLLQKKNIDKTKEKVLLKEKVA